MTALTPWQALVEEHTRVRLGPAWLALVSRVAARVSRRYPGRLYGLTGDVWTEQDVDDLVQEVVLERLIADGQIEYIVASCTAVPHAEGLVGMHVKQALAQRVAPTQADNVAGRLWAEIQSIGEPVPGAPEPAYRRPGTPWIIDPAAEAYPVAIAAAVLSSLPRLPNRGTQRLSPVFATPVLQAAVTELWDAVPRAVDRRLIGEICSYSLTGLMPTIFHLGEGTAANAAGDEMTPDEEVLVRDTLEQLLTELSDEHLEVVAGAGVLTDADLAARLGMSRPTVIKRRKEASGLILRAVDDLRPDMQDAVVLRLQDLVGVRRAP